MKFRSYFSLGITLCLALSVLAQNPAVEPAPAEKVPIELSALRVNFEKALKAGRDAIEKRRTQLDGIYTANLGALQAQAQKAGNLTELLALKAEQERFQARQELTPEQRTAMPAALGTLLARYEVSLKTIAGDAARQDQSLYTRHAQELQDLKVELTKKGRIEDALVVKNERDAIVARQVEATAALASAAPAETAPATPSPENLATGVTSIKTVTPAAATPAHHMVLNTNVPDHTGGKVDRSNPAEVTVEGCTARPVADSEYKKNLAWKADFEGAKIFEGGKGTTVDFTVTKSGRVFVFCSYEYEGSSGPWSSEVWTREDFAKKGWGTSFQTEPSGRGKGTAIFSKVLPAGTKLTIRCNKYSSPRVLVF